MSTKSAQHRHGGQVPFQARRKVILVTVVILLFAAAAWIMTYTRAVATTPTGSQAPIIDPAQPLNK
jgi:hypothetical protein